MRKKSFSVQSISFCLTFFNLVKQDYPLRENKTGTLFFKMVHKWFSWLVKQSKSHRGVLCKILMKTLNLKDVAPILKKARGIYHRFHSLWFITTVTFRIHWHIVDFVHWHIVQHIVQLYSILYIHLYSMCTCTAYCTLVQHVHLYSTLYTCTECALVQHVHLYSILHTCTAFHV